MCADKQGLRRSGGNRYEGAIATISLNIHPFASRYFSLIRRFRRKVHDDAPWSTRLARAVMMMMQDGIPPHR
jgi:hypothetical protein